MRADATLFVHPNDHPQDSDLVEIDDEGFVAALHPYPHAEGTEYDNLVNAALYVMRRDGLEPLIPREGKADLAKDLFPQMLRAGRRLFAYISPEYIKDVGTPERLDRVAADIQAGLPDRLSARALRSAVFLDRDGTVNVEVNYVRTPEQLALLPGVPEALQRLNRSGHLAVIVTNQSVVARGDVTFAGLKRIHTRLTHLLGARHAYVDRIYVCPHHPDRGFPGEVAELKIVCSCRKPATGMVDDACRDLQIDRARVVDRRRHHVRHGNGPAGGTSDHPRSDRPRRTGRALSIPPRLRGPRPAGGRVVDPGRTSGDGPPHGAGGGGGAPGATGRDRRTCTDWQELGGAGSA